MIIGFMANLGGNCYNSMPIAQPWPANPQAGLERLTMKRFVIALVLVMIAQPLAESGDATPAEDARLERLFKDYLDTEFKHRPLDATRLGDHRFDDLLDDVSPKARAANAARARKMLAELPSIAEIHLEANNRTWDTVVEQGEERGVFTDARPPYGCLGLRLRR